MTFLLGVQTVFKTLSKHFKYTINSFKKRVLVIPKCGQDAFIQDMSVTPKALQIEYVKHVCILFLQRAEDQTKPLHGDNVNPYWHKILIAHKGKMMKNVFSSFQTIRQVYLSC